VEAIGRLRRPPKVMVCASAIGFYGDRGEEILNEESPAGRGFLPYVCKAWESEALPASSRGTRVVRLRIGVVLSADGGALARMLPPFRLGVGGVLGTGRQYMSWVSLDDLCGIVEHVLLTESLSGAVNAVSPRPVTNREFTQTLAGALGRPALFSVPRCGARVALGELADALLLASTRVLPAKLQASGFGFRHPDLSLAMAHIVPGVSNFNSTQWIGRPPVALFPFFASAGNLDTLTPPWLRFEILNPGAEMRSGALIDYKLRLHGIPLRWQSEIIQWDPPRRFVDVQRHGPYGLWVHDHRFEARDGGTLVHDNVHYCAPGGTLIRKLFVQRDLDRIFSYRRERLEEQFA